MQTSEQQENDLLSQRIAIFVERFAPRDFHNGQFHSMLHEIIRATYAEAVRPFNNAMIYAATHSAVPVKFTTGTPAK